MATLNFRQLIDLAIGTPEPGHVNFHALHCLLYSFAEHLNIMETNVDCTKYGNINASMIVNESPAPDSSSPPVAPGAVSGGDGDDNVVSKDVSGDGGNTMDASLDPTRPGGDADPSNGRTSNEALSASPTNAMTGEAGRVAGGPESSIEPGSSGQLRNANDGGVGGEKEMLQESITSQGLAVQKLEVRLSQVESGVQSGLSVDVTKGLAVMKEQIELTIDNIQTLSRLQFNASDAINVAETKEKLKNNLRRLKKLREANVYIKPLDEEPTVDSESDERDIDEDLEGADSHTQTAGIVSKSMPGRAGVASVDDRYSLDMHLCYSPEKLLDQLMDLKAEFCMLTNKTNDMAALVLQLESQRTAKIVHDIQEELREMKAYNVSIKELADSLQAQHNQSNSHIEQIHKVIKELADDKIDRGEIAVLLANKVDYKQLQRKVSHEQVEEIKCKLERQVCSLGKLLDSQERNFQREMDYLRDSLGSAAIEQILKRSKDKIEADLKALTETLEKYMESTNDECAAAGARIKVLQDLACLSCDTTCVMRTAEKARVPKLPNAHAGSMLAPLVTYELSSIRKSGLMGYYRKDDFPHSPSAWLNKKNMPIKACVPRHAGGPHTTSTAKERVDKVLLNKK